MPIQASKKPVSVAVKKAPVPVPAPVKSRNPSMPKPRANAKVKAPEPEPETETPVTEVTAVTPPPTETPARERRDVTAESVDTEFTNLITAIQEECNNSKATKFLRGVNKRLVVLQRDTRKIAKQKRKTGERTPNPNSAFVKLQKISDELADFLGLEHGTELSRTDVTKRLHQYIVDNNLQNDKNKREIVPNKALAKLLGYKQKDCVDPTPNKRGDAKNPEGQLYYWVMQQLIQKHFIK